MRHLCLVFILSFATGGAWASQVIAQDLAGTGSPCCTSTPGEFYGQAFTTPGGGPWNSLAFNFYSDVPATTPVAAGTAFLLTQQYLGEPGALSMSTPGFLAESIEILDGQYIFAPRVQILGNTSYWIYENGPLQVSGGDTQPGALSYISIGTFDYPLVGGVFSILNGENSNFTLESTAPEPASYVPVLIGFLLFRFRSRRS